MSATVASSLAILKRMYPNGELPNATYTNFPTLALMPKMTELGGDDYQSSLQNENPQAAASNYADAANNFIPGTYNRFLVTRVKHYSLARIQGDAMEAARSKGATAMIDLWANETKGASTTEQKCLSTYLFGTGSGALAQVSGGVGTNTLTLTSSDAVINLDLGMLLTAVSADDPATAVVRGGGARITSITRDPDAAAVGCTGAAWNVQIPGLVANDFLARVGDTPVGGVARVITGLPSWIAGGSAPGTLFGLNRNTDPVRLAGQTKSYAGTPMEEAIIDAEARLGFQGSMVQGKLLVANNRDVANLKKALSAKVVYDRVKSAVAGISFKSIEVEGDYGPIQVVADPFCPRGTAYMLNKETFQLCSMGAAPRILDFDGNRFLRVANDDAYEVRFGFYGFFKCSKPVDNFRLTGFGV